MSPPKTNMEIDPSIPFADTPELTNTNHTPICPWVYQLEDVAGDIREEARILDAQFVDAEKMIHEILCRLNAAKAKFLDQVNHCWTPAEIEAAKEQWLTYKQRTLSTATAIAAV